MAAEKPATIRTPGRVKNAARPSVGLAGDAASEAIQARRGNFSHREAVRVSAFLSARYRKMWSAMADFEINVDTIIRALQTKRIPFVMTGAHGIAGWTGRPRATHDVDIIVRAGRNHARAVKAIHEVYPELELV